MANSTKKNRTNRGLLIEDELYEDIGKIAEDQNTYIVEIVDRALRMYRDAHYMETKSYVIPQEILKTVRAELDLNDQRSSNRILKLMSDMAINAYISNKIIAENLNVNDGQLEALRVEAVESIQDAQRVLQLGDFF